MATKLSFVGHTLKSSICGHHTLVSPRSTRSFSVIRVEILSVKVPSLIVNTLLLSWTWFYFKIINGFGFFITQGYDFGPEKHPKELITWRYMHPFEVLVQKNSNLVIDLHFWSKTSKACLCRHVITSVRCFFWTENDDQSEPLGPGPISFGPWIPDHNSSAGYVSLVLEQKALMVW